MQNKNNFNETFSKIVASQNLRDKVLSMPEKYPETEVKSHHPKKRITRSLLIAAVVAGLLALTACGYTVFKLYQNPEPMLEAAFGENGHAHVESTVVTEDRGEYGKTQWIAPEINRVPLNKELADTLVAPYLCAVGETYEYGGYTLTVEAYTYDEATHAGLVYYSLENPAGVSGYEVQPDGEIWWPEGDMITFGHIRCRSHLVSHLTTDTKLTCIGYFYHFIHEAEPEKPNPQTQLYVKLNILQIPGPMAPDGWFEQKNEPENPVQWDIPEQKDFPGAVLPLMGFGGSLNPIAHREFAEGKIIVSPYSLRYAKDFCESETGSVGSSFQSVKLLFKDGTEYVVVDENVANYTVNAGEGDRYPSSGTTICFNRVVNPEDVETVFLDGKPYKMQSEK